MFLGPETSQETLKRPKSRPRDTQGPPKRHAKKCQKNPNKCLCGKKCLKPAISLWTCFGTPFWSHCLLIFKLIFYTFFLPLFRKMLKLILEPILGSERPKRAKMSQKEPSGASKNQKPSFSKTLKTIWFFKGFWLQRLLKKASRGPRWLPKDTQKIQDPKK